MKIIPAIDLQNGKCVRLYKGDFDQATVYANDPVAMAARFKKQGITYIHVVDLDGAKMESLQHEGIVTDMIKQTGLQLQYGGGIRTAVQIQRLLNYGITRIILGSIAVKDPDLVQQWLQQFGADKIILALDVREKDGDFYLTTHGWQLTSAISLWELLNDYSQTELKHILCTDISRDGTLSGPNIALYKKIIERHPQLNLQASGGVASETDIRNLSSLPLEGVIVGKALYENKINLSNFMGAEDYVS